MDLTSMYLVWAVSFCPPGTARAWAEARGWRQLVELYELGGSTAWSKDFRAWHTRSCTFDSAPGSGELYSTQRAR